MPEPLPALQQRASELVPELIAAIEAQPYSDAMGESHPAIQMIRRDFSGADDNRMMGALLRAYIEPILRHGVPQNKQEIIANLQDVVAGNIDVTWLRKRSDEEKTLQPKFMMLPKGTLGMHVITKDVLEKAYGVDTGKRLAAAIAPLAASELIPNLITVGLHKFTTKEVQSVFKNELAAMQQEGTNPFAGLSVLEIGGGTEVARMPQTGSFAYKNITAGGKYASPDDMDYVSLSNLPETKYDYVMTNNVISLVVPERTLANSGAAAVNGNLFCTCANLTKAGGKIIHTNSYDQIASPVLIDNDLYQLAGVEIVEPLDRQDLHKPNKIWVYRKANEGCVSEAGYNEWTCKHNKFVLWDNAVTTELERNPRALRSAHRMDLLR